MYDANRTHPLLAQVPLTVSPFISLPSAVTLPYTYKSVPATLPQSALADSIEGEKPKYVVSESGHAAHPDEIIASCRGLQAHLLKTQEDAARTIREWEAGIRERELAEKRRVAPGWLDREEKILEPTKVKPDHSKDESLLDGDGTEHAAGARVPALRPNREAEELDRAFGKLDTK